MRGTAILNKVSGKAHCEGGIWAKTEAGEAGSLADNLGAKASGKVLLVECAWKFEGS